MSAFKRWRTLHHRLTAGDLHRALARIQHRGLCAGIGEGVGCQRWRAYTAQATATWLK
jgi:hypothetical protein